MILRRDYAWFRSLRWGRSVPGAVLWWIATPLKQFVIVDEFKFSHLDPSECADEIRARDAALGMKFSDNSPNPPRYIAAESKLWKIDDDNKTAPTIAELFARAQMPLLKSSGDRVQGWNVLSSLMKSKVCDPRFPDIELPALVVSEHCSQLRRLIPLLREGQGTGAAAKEDIDQKSDTALVEALRVGAMSRPSATEIEPPRPGPGTMGHALEQARHESEHDPDYYG